MNISHYIARDTQSINVTFLYLHIFSWTFQFILPRDTQSIHVQILFVLIIHFLFVFNEPNKHVIVVIFQLCQRWLYPLKTHVRRWGMFIKWLNHTFFNIPHCFCTHVYVSFYINSQNKIKFSKLYGLHNFTISFEKYSIWYFLFKLKPTHIWSKKNCTNAKHVINHRTSSKPLVSHSKLLSIRVNFFESNYSNLTAYWKGKQS